LGGGFCPPSEASPPRNALRGQSPRSKRTNEGSATSLARSLSEKRVPFEISGERLVFRAPASLAQPIWGGGSEGGRGPPSELFPLLRQAPQQMFAPGLRAS